MEGPEASGKDYPFIESINNLLCSPTKVIVGAPTILSDEVVLLAPKMVNCEPDPLVVPFSSPLKLTLLEDGEIVDGSISMLAPGSIGSPPVMSLLKDPSFLITPTLGKGLSSPRASSSGCQLPTDDGWITQRCKNRNVKTCVGVDLKTSRPSQRLSRQKEAARDVANGRQRTLETSIRGNK